MNQKNFTLCNKICAAVAFLVAAVTYLCTIEPSASFWDCGEFIASSYKLEVGHPPGNPVFQIIARVFCIFTDGAHAAVAVNSLSAICSALTIFFLYLTIVFFAKRIEKPGQDGEYSLTSAIAICGSGLVGALAYCFSDTFWFSAVEGEVYAMSSLFTAAVFWAMTRWYEQAGSDNANRWIVLISFLMGLSIGVHLLNLLTIPCLVFFFYYKKRENGSYSLWEYVKIFLLSCVILGVINFILIPYLPKMAAYFDLFFVNSLGLPFNSGAIFFMLALLVLLFWGIFKTMKAGKVFLNTVLLCTTMLVIGFSIFSVCIIRSCAKTPTNEYQPDNPFTLVRYLSREQYGKTPLIYGQYFDSPYEVEMPQYWAPVGDKYIKAQGTPELKYDSAGKMLFPRMWSSSTDGRNEEFYEAYMNGGGVKVAGAEHAKPTFFQNLYFFFDYQLGWMYWRYFMWNFAGRQNEIHGQNPGDIFVGNWESGIGFLDQLRLGDQSDAPGYLANNKGKNHYFLLPLLLGLLGLFFQYSRDGRGAWLTFLLFFMTGIAIVIYLNQPPFQVRERDYAYAGSFYAFCIWIGMAVAGLVSFLEGVGNPKTKAALATVISLACCGVPALMAAQNWDDHDRSNRRTAVELASNYLNSVGQNGILITHGDNDTFPLWYAQEVEGIRTDVRICNTSLLGTDWHIDQMKYACNESSPLPLTVGMEQYLYGTNEIVHIYDTREQVIPIADVMRVFKHPSAKLSYEDGTKVDYIMSRKISIPVIKENVIKYGILDEKYADLIPDEIVLTISKDKSYITKQELFMLDLLAGYKWDRPISMLAMGGDLNIGIKDYLMYDGFSYKFVPVRNRQKQAEVGFADAEDLYDKMKTVYKFDALKRTDYCVDYQNFYTFTGVMSHRMLFYNAASVMLREGQKDRAIEMLDMCQEVMPECNYPLDILYLGFSNELMVLEMATCYFNAGAPEKGLDLAQRFVNELYKSAFFFAGFYDLAKDEFETCCQYVYYVSDLLKKSGYEKEAQDIENGLSDALRDYV